MENKEYHFDNIHHYHYLGDKRLTGVTTVLSVIAKPMLIQWAANQAVDYVDNKLRDKELYLTIGEGGSEEINIDGENLDILLKEARTAHAQKRDKAGDAGTKTHAEIEGIIKGAIKISAGILPYSSGKEKEQVKHFLNWARDNKVKFLSSEEHCYSEKLFLGGIADFLCEIEGDIYIGDIKTGSGIYPEHFAQTSAYQMMLEETKGIKIKGHIILNLKKDGTFTEKRSISNEDFRKFFLAALDIYRIQQKIENQIL